MKGWPSSLRLISALILGATGLVLCVFLTNLQLREATSGGNHPTAPSDPNESTETCSLGELPTLALAEFLNETSLSSPHRIMTFLDLSPELMYRTPYETVATPYHRNTAGILDDFHVMEAVDDSAAEAIVRRRGVTCILVCPTLDESRAYYGTDKPGTLYRRLLDNRPPDWLKAVDLPPALQKHFKLWAVIPKNEASVGP